MALAGNATRRIRGRGVACRELGRFETACIFPAADFRIVLPPGTGAIKPRASNAYTATFALLQASIVAVSSDWFSEVSGKPPEKRTTIFLPAMLRRFFARLRTASSMLRAPKSASALLKVPNDENPAEATVTGTSGPDAWGSTDEFLTPDTAARSKFALAVKFCTMRSAPECKRPRS
jgi:hypothetical protein